MPLLREGSEIMGEVKNTMAESLDRLRRMCESVDAQAHLIAERDEGTQKFLEGHRQDMEDLYKGIVEAYKDSERQKYETDGLVYMSDAWAGDMVRASNAAKMRAALEQIAHYDDSEYGMDDYGCADGHNCADIARAALAEPSRNCDVIAPQNLVDEFCKFMDFDVMDERNGFADGQYKFMQEHWFEFSKWITMPYAPEERR